MQYYRYLDKPGETYRYGLKAMQLYKQNPKMLQIENWKYGYGTILTEMLLISLRIFKNKKEFLYSEIQNLNIPHFKNLALINILDAYIQSGDFKKGEKIMANIQRPSLTGIENHNRLILYMNLAIMKFGLGHYTKSLFWLNEIINTPVKESGSFPYFAIVRLIRLLTFYELKKLDLLEYEIGNTSKYIEKHQKKFTTDHLILDGLSKMAAINNKAALKKAMEETRNKLLKLTKIKTELKTFELFDFISWFDSKIENRSFEEAVKERYVRSI